MQTARATLPVEGTAAVTAFRAFAETAGREVSTEGAGLRIRLNAGALIVRPAGTVAELEIESPDSTGLQTIRDLLVERLAGMGMSPDWHDDLSGRQPGDQVRATIRSVTRISPGFSRVVMEGPDLGVLAGEPPHFRLLLGPDGAPWPVTDSGGVTCWPGGVGAWHRPVYTIREVRTAGGATRASFDVFRHEGGRVTRWADRILPGDAVAVTGPRGRGFPAPVGWLGLIGDETAVPVIARILANLRPEARGEAHLVVPEAADVQALRGPDGVRIRWHLRSSAATPVSALNALDLPGTDRHVFFAAERSEAQVAREWLTRRGLGAGEMRTAAYWTAG